MTTHGRHSSFSRVAPWACALAACALTACGGGRAGHSGDSDGAPTGATDAGPPLGDAAPPAADAHVPPASRVIPIYITATDNTQDQLDRRTTTFENILGGIQDWYGETMGARYDRATFYFEPVRVLAGHYTSAQWLDFGRNGFLYPDGHRTSADGACAMWYGALYELQDLGLLADAGLPALGTDGVFYYVVNGGGDNGSCGAGGYLAASEAQLLDDAAQQCPTGRFDADAIDCRAPGAIAHEAGHGFGLPHAADRPTCTGGPSVMDVWWLYDDGASLCEEDKADLAASGYFTWRAGW